MAAETLRAALEREHHEIDGGIEATVAALEQGEVLTAPLVTALAALRRHIYLEEEFVFTPLRDAGMAMPVFVMLREHGELWRSMDGVEALLAGEAAPDRVVKACQELLAQLDRHNSKEEPVIYPVVDAALTPEAHAELESFLESGHTPDGWVCQQA